MRTPFQQRSGGRKGVPRVECPNESVTDIAIPAMTSQKLTAFPVTKTKRRYSALDATKRFIRDGFVDQYTSEHLVFPGVLRLLSRLFETEFPYHPNWKFGVCHYWYWELYPTVDHVVPVTAAGSDSEENWVTTSMMYNLKKSNRILPPGVAHPGGDTSAVGRLDAVVHPVPGRPPRVEAGLLSP